MTSASPLCRKVEPPSAAPAGCTHACKWLGPLRRSARQSPSSCMLGSSRRLLDKCALISRTGLSPPSPIQYPLAVPRAYLSQHEAPCLTCCCLPTLASSYPLHAQSSSAHLLCCPPLLSQAHLLGCIFYLPLLALGHSTTVQPAPCSMVYHYSPHLATSPQTPLVPHCSPLGWACAHHPHRALACLNLLCCARTFHQWSFASCRHHPTSVVAPPTNVPHTPA
jgi:hypothetical protein